MYSRHLQVAHEPIPTDHIRAGRQLLQALHQLESPVVAKQRMTCREIELDLSKQLEAGVPADAVGSVDSTAAKKQPAGILQAARLLEVGDGAALVGGNLDQRKLPCSW